MKSIHGPLRGYLQCGRSHIEDGIHPRKENIMKAKPRTKEGSKKKRQADEVIGIGERVDRFLAMLEMVRQQSRVLQEMTRTLAGEEWEVLSAHPLQVTITETIAQLALLKGDIVKRAYKTWLPKVLPDKGDVVVESFGNCRNAYKRRNKRLVGCKSLEVVLGDGLCTEYWDARASTGATAADVRDLAAENGVSDLTENEANTVLKLAKKEIDAAIAINWELLGAWVFFVVLQRDSENVKA
tara:strand:+ start:234 stop:953 length:720 start_codon:yes stop_codon:yes gene_type:complete